MKKLFVLAIILCLAALAVGLTACDKVKVAKIEVDNAPQKTNYYIGEQLDTAGCTINVLYSDNSVRTVDVTADMVSALDASAVGPKSVIITYTEDGVSYTTSMTVHVVSRPPSSLRVLTPPDKVEYIEGEPIDLTGLTVEVGYTDTQRITVTERDLSYPSLTATTDMTSVTVGFASLTLDVPIRVIPVAITGIEASVVDGSVYRNQTLSLYLFNVQYVYNNGTRAPILDATFAEEGEVVADVAPLTLHFAKDSYQCTLPITPVEDEVAAVSLASAPYGYAVGDAFRWRDVVLSVDFAHASDVTYTMGRDTYAGLTLSVADGTVLESGALDVSVGDASRTYTTFRVGIGDVVPVRWRVASGGDRVVEVSVGSVPQPVNLMLYAVLSDGNEVLVWHRGRAEAGVEVTLPSAAVAGQTEATMYYRGFPYTFPIRVVE